MDWAQILVIILSVFLVLFLLAGIVLTVLLIRLTQQIRSVTESAKRTADEIEGVVHTINKFSSPSLMTGPLMKQAKKFTKSSKRKSNVKTICIWSSDWHGGGVVAGVLTAPKSGKETRADIKAKAQELKDKAADMSDEALRAANT